MFSVPRQVGSLRRLVSTAQLRSLAPTTQQAASIHVFHTIEEVRKWRTERYAKKESVGFVPTMGALHAGHVSLAAYAKECDKVIASIFVNPTQFLPGEDFNAYPRTLEADVEKLKAVDVDAVFAPNAAEMYPVSPPWGTYVVPEGADNLAEGVIRPGHFRGVATVCTKLFNIVQPCKAFFGQKDGLQCIVLRKIVRDLNMNLKVVVCPTVRESDGLAMSSRNVYLAPNQRALAPLIYQSLQAGARVWASGERDPRQLKRAVADVLASKQQKGLWEPEYVSIADGFSGEDLPEDRPMGTSVMLAVAVRTGKTRLIDNIMLGQTD